LVSILGGGEVDDAESRPSHRRSSSTPQCSRKASRTRAWRRRMKSTR
jgi:hypothetical protein